MQIRKPVSSSYAVSFPQTIGSLSQSMGISLVSGSFATLNWYTPVFDDLIWVVSSTASGSAYATSGIEYVPLTSGSVDSILYQFTSKLTGIANFRFSYAMSVANTGSVALQISKMSASLGGSPDNAFSSSVGFTITPGNDAALHLLSEVSSSTLSMNVTSGMLVRVKLERTGSGDTHTGDMRIIEARVVY